MTKPPTPPPWSFGKAEWLLLGLFVWTVATFSTSQLSPLILTLVGFLGVTIPAGAALTAAIFALKASRASGIEPYLKPITTALLMFFLAELSWDIMELGWGYVPYPSVADALWVAGYAAEGIMLSLLFGRFHTTLTAAAKFVWLAVSLTALLTYALLELPEIIAFEGETAPLLFDITYSLASPILLLLATGATLTVWRNKLGIPLLAIVVASAINSFADIWYIFLSHWGEYYASHMVDLLYGLAYVNFAYGIYNIGLDVKPFQTLFESTTKPPPTNATPTEDELKGKCTLCSRPLTANLHEETIDDITLRFCSVECKRAYRWLITTYGSHFTKGTKEQPEEAQTFKFKNEQAEKVFQYLANEFVEDYMNKTLILEKSGWRSLVQIWKTVKVPKSSLYASNGRLGGVLGELTNLGVVETRIFPGERGRGGEILRVRTAYLKKPIRQYIDHHFMKGTISFPQ